MLRLVASDLQHVWGLFLLFRAVHHAMEAAELIMCCDSQAQYLTEPDPA